MASLPVSAKHPGANGAGRGAGRMGSGLVGVVSPVASAHVIVEREAAGGGLRAVLHALALVVAWYTLSTLLSLYNKKLLGRKYGLLDGQPFPAPVMMTSVQFTFQHALARLFHAAGVRRTLPAGEAVPWAVYVRTVLPNGIATGLDIGFSNASFALITLSFYTMCKSSAPLFLLLFAFLWRIEAPTWSLAGTVALISAGLLMLVAGEAEFNAAGFALVMSAACLSGLRWTITQISLQGGDGGGGHSVARGTALEVMESLTPVMALTTGACALASEPLWHAWRTSIYFSTAAHVGLSLGLIAVGSVLAFFMVWVEFALISSTSALTFMVAGVFKEIVTVLVAHFVYGDRFTPLNGAGLGVLMAGVALFNVQKYRAAAAGAGGGGEGGCAGDRARRTSSCVELPGRDGDDGGEEQRLLHNGYTESTEKRLGRVVVDAASPEKFTLT